MRGDHHGMGLVLVPFDGNNYFAWVRSIKFALGAKQKLDFIDGSCSKPTGDKNEIEQWRRSDYVVVSLVMAMGRVWYGSARIQDTPHLIFARPITRPRPAWTRTRPAPFHFCLPHNPPPPRLDSYQSRFI
ncbi:hypothetical protein Sango_1259700 [Sesamum angolense]|uniref:Retrotransposon Copia-like N-terminal domain-containing protein n=1 Tax=Sesamum angolense TaxID=2727404 RepID=A0AAE1WRC2_9LAMI|nr:hypothetical protein Sango_1259700 [Sesamum angolense]